MALHIVDQRQQAITQFDAQQIERERGSDGFFLGCGFGFGFFFLLFLGDARRFLALEGEPGCCADGRGEQGENKGRHAGQQADDAHHRRRHAERLRIEGKLIHQRLIGRAFDTGLGDHKARRRRNDEGRHLADETVADGQQGEGLRRVAEAHAFLHHGDDDAADDVDADNQQARDGVAAHEFAGAVHGAEEIGFAFQLLAAAAGFGFVDKTGGQIGVHRHLLAGHGVQGEARGDFRDTARTFGDDHEVHDHQDREHDEADHEIAAHDEVAEGLNHIAGRLRARRAVFEDEARGSEVQRQTHHRGDEQHGGEGAEFQRFADEHAGHQDQD